MPFIQMTTVICVLTQLRNNIMDTRPCLSKTPIDCNYAFPEIKYPYSYTHTYTYTYIHLHIQYTVSSSLTDSPVDRPTDAPLTQGNSVVLLG